ncbi:MAG TPA: peptidylprolyl isomerase [Kofleriaceae bacterium]|nr:peptidylprolyl isomerase [Kofleriaceae bacterium]
MRSTTALSLALITLALGACDHKKKDNATTANPPGGSGSAGGGGGNADEVRPPTAADLEAYTKDIQGTGPLKARIETPLGTINCELLADKAPMTVANFVGLATGKKAWRNASGAVEKGKPYFDNLTFHRVIPGFMIQGGDPLGQGTGGPGYNFDDEFAQGLTMDPGTLAMANAGPGTNGSQFFIMEGSAPGLVGKHTIFGKCAEVEVVKKITAVPRDPNDKPNEPVTMKITISKG